MGERSRYPNVEFAWNVDAQQAHNGEWYPVLAAMDWLEFRATKLVRARVFRLRLGDWSW